MTATVSSERFVLDGTCSSKELRSSDKLASSLQQTSATKSGSNSRKSKKSIKKSIYQYTDSSSTTFEDAKNSTCLSWLHRMLCFLYLVLLFVCGVTPSIMIFNEVLDGHIDLGVSDSLNKFVDLGVSDSVKNELPR